MASERAESSAEAATPTPVSSNPTPVPTIATTLDVAAQTPSLREPIVIARVDPSQASTAAEAEPAASGEPAPPTRTIASSSPAPAAQEDSPRSVADAFDGFTLAPAPPASASGAVDITRIAIPREKAEPKPPPPPAHPARHWVQVATGKDRDALKFDWRRSARKAEGLLDGKGPFVTPWVEANRLLSGPYDSATKAREMMNQLKALGVDSFTFTSAEGEAIEKL
ncbi:MAG: SPOR domain-containing protein [Pseudomonadota bacterium]|nr:SPOR domain-containing protein [Pseudomonadota bacterium]